MIGPNTTLREQAFLVCTALHNVGTTAVLTGGSAASVYAPQRYQSQDLDFVLTFIGKPGNERALSELGFERRGSMYVHPRNPLTLDFPEGPLAVGSETIRTWTTLREEDGLLHILTATDCVKDRLAGFLFWNDRQSLSAAVAVAQQCPGEVELDRVESWCAAEGGLKRFEEFRKRLERKG